MSTRQTRTTFSIPTKRITQVGRKTYLSNQPQIRLIQTIQGTRYVGVSFSSSFTPDKIIQEAQKQMLVVGNEPKVLCLYNLPYYFTDGKEPINASQFYNLCLTYGYSPIYEILNQSNCETYKPIILFVNYLKSCQMYYEIIGFEYLTVVKSIPEECRDFRSALARVRQEEFEWATTNFDKRILEENEYVYIESEPPISNLEEKLRINGRYGNDMSMKTIVHLPTDSIEEVISNLFTKLQIMKPTIFNSTESPSNFVLKVRGSNEFLIPFQPNGEMYRLKDFDYIRKCVHLHLPIDVVLFNRENMHHNLWDEPTIEMMKHFDQFVGNDNWNLIQNKTRFLSQRECQTPVCVQIISAEGVKHYKITKTKDEKEVVSLDEDMKIYFVASLHYGARLLEKDKFTPVYQIVEGKLSLSEPVALTFDILISTLPKEARLTISIYMTELPVDAIVTDINKKDICLATVNCKIVDYHGYFVKGMFKVGMWERTEPNPIMMCCENTSSETCKIQYRMIEFNKPIIMDTFIGTEEEMNIPIDTSQRLDLNDTKIFKEAVEADPLTPLSLEDCRLLWNYRLVVMKTKPRSIARLVSAVDFTKQSEVLELHRLLNKWPLLEPSHALELLDFRFPDEQVRLFALKCLDAMKDYELVDFLPQLIQALKFELHHQSYLAYFLLRRALRNKNIIGHQFFWSLKAEMFDNRVTERYGCLLEAFLNGCEDYKTELYNEVTFQNQLVVIANKVKLLDSRDEQKQLLKDSLAKLTYPEEMSLPLDPRFRFKKPVPNTGNVFSSKKKPLMLVLENVDPLGDNIMVIQKVGDDLRQDVLTLQMLRLMNNIWKSAGIDLRMLPYHCIATGNEIGILELVQDAETYGKIIADEGGQGTLRIFKENLLTKWLKKQCSRKESKVTFEEAVENFTYSCAGYCVATYILGIGDRHSDNVMIRRDGKFFHIDFGHFLGNFKSKFGVRRERTPFKFTPHFAHVMGGKGSPQFKLFEDLCLRAFACIRKQGSLFIYLFRLMLATGIPELQTEKDIEYMRDTFMFDKKDDEAKEVFRELIYSCLDAKSQTLNDMIHDFVHYK